MKATTYYIWEQNFPPVWGHTSISYLKRCPDFARAKNGDLRAASRIVSACVKPRRLADFARTFPCAVLLPVMTDNQLPYALAQALAGLAGLEVCTDIHLTREDPRKQMNAMQRLLYQPVFSGITGRSCILVDDIVTQGGTVSALRKHVIDCGGRVVGVMALAYSAGCGILSPKYDNIQQLEDKFGYTNISNLLRRYRISNNPLELTNCQIEYLLRFKDLDSIAEKIHATMAQKHRSPNYSADN